jgi:transposase
MNSSGGQRQRRVVDWVGVDVSKASFDAAFARMDQKLCSTRLCDLPVRRFERTRQGVECFVDWLSALSEDDGEQGQVRVAMEATGNYSIELAVWMLELRPSLQPAVVCPSHTAAFITSLGSRNKTDALEARALAFYGVEREPLPYEPPSAELAELRALSRYRDALVCQRTAAANRAREGGPSKLVRHTQAKRLRLLNGDIKRIEAEMNRLVKAAPQITHDVALLTSIYGVGFIVAVVIVAELGDLRRFRKARKLTAFAGVSPRVYQSGTSVARPARMCKKGNPRVRQVLYLSALVAVRGRNNLQRTYTRLLTQGKSPMAALGAVMRKLLVVMRALLITNTTYDPDWQPQTQLRYHRALNTKIA